MKIMDLFEVVLPAKKVSLDVRVRELQKNGIAFAIYASNFVPFMLKVTVDGKRQLAVGEFDTEMTAEEAHLEIENNDQYKEALIEDFLVVVGDQRLADDGHPGIVCTGARFDNMGPEEGKTTPYMSPTLESISGEEKQAGHTPKKVRSVGLAPENAYFRPSTKFLLVKK